MRCNRQIVEGSNLGRKVLLIIQASSIKSPQCEQISQTIDADAVQQIRDPANMVYKRFNNIWDYKRVRHVSIKS